MPIMLCVLLTIMTLGPSADNPDQYFDFAEHLCLRSGLLAILIISLAGFIKKEWNRWR